MQPIIVTKTVLSAIQIALSRIVLICALRGQRAEHHHVKFRFEAMPLLCSREMIPALSALTPRNGNAVGGMVVRLRWLGRMRGREFSN